MSFFQNVKTVEELKRQWRNLVKHFHPDLGGTDEDMKQLNLEYDHLLRRIGNIHEGKDGNIWEDTKGPKDRYSCNIEDLDDGFRAVVLEVLKMKGIDVLLVGSWVWLEGDTKPWKDALKKLGFKWSGPRQRWYWHKAGHFWGHASKATFEDICLTYGVRKAVKGEKKEQEERLIA